MKKVKEMIKKINKTNLIKLFRSKEIIKSLNNKIGELEIEKIKLNDKVRKLNIEAKKIEDIETKISSMELVIESSDKSLKNKLDEIKQLREDKIKLECELFEVKNELACANMQKEEYEAEIKDLKSNRYLVKKIPSGRKPITNRTKVSNQMRASVINYMRGEHE